MNGLTSCAGVERERERERVGEKRREEKKEPTTSPFVIEAMGGSVGVD